MELISTYIHVDLGLLMAEQSVPLPPKRTKFITVAENQWKTALVDSFKGFSANQVSQEHVDKATACMRQGGTRDERYRLVPFERILYDNQVRTSLSLSLSLSLFFFLSFSFSPPPSSPSLHLHTIIIKHSNMENQTTSLP